MNRRSAKLLRPIAKNRNSNGKDRKEIMKWNKIVRWVPLQAKPKPSKTERSIAARVNQEVAHKYNGSKN